MNKKRTKTFRFLLVLFAIAILFGCGGDKMRLKESLNDFLKILESGNLNDLSLSIYYDRPFSESAYSLGVDDLIRIGEDQKIVISGGELEKHIDLLKRLGNADLIPVKREAFLDTRLCYVFRTDKDGWLLDVATNGLQIDKKGELADLCIFVNGFAVEEDDVFYDVLLPFLTEDALSEWGPYLSERR